MGMLEQPCVFSVEKSIVLNPSVELAPCMRESYSIMYHAVRGERTVLERRADYELY
jgi:hypothetical protein